MYDVLVVGGEPAAFSCADRLTSRGTRVAHIYATPFGLLGASRDIGLAYPELGEPWERLRDALGQEVGEEFHHWGKSGIEALTEVADHEAFFTRGSRLAVARNESEAKLTGSDAIARQTIGDEVRLMSGAAASNYAPLSDLLQASFETHAAAFPPVKLSEFLANRLRQRENYQAFPLEASTAWAQCRLDEHEGRPRVVWSEEDGLQGEVVVVAAALESGRFLNKYSSVLVGLPGQAFRSPPLREVSRSSVVGVSGAWGYERFRFDPEMRLLGCGVDPTKGACATLEVDSAVLEVFLQRSRALFMDLFCEVEDLLQWGVQFTLSCDGLPVLGPVPGDPRVHVIAGFGTSSWSRGYRAGQVIAEALTTEKYRNPLLTRCSARRFL